MSERTCEAPDDWSAAGSLPGRIVAAYRARGIHYVGYKILKRLLQNRPWLARRLLYRSPRWYWEQRGGIDYFREQESQQPRTVRSEFIAQQVARHNAQSLLEVGCGYGKQLAALHRHVADFIVGIDWSGSQLGLAQSLLADYPKIALIQGNGARLPFPSKSFDVVLTSAVILHNPPPLAAEMIREICRVGRRLAIHNEDRNVSFSRFGLDIASEYRNLGYRVLECRSIPGADDSANTQFCVVDLQSSESAIAGTHSTGGRS